LKSCCREVTPGKHQKKTDAVLFSLLQVLQAGLLIAVLLTWQHFQRKVKFSKSSISCHCKFPQIGDYFCFSEIICLKPCIIYNNLWQNLRKRYAHLRRMSEAVAKPSEKAP
jgi:hypothetical protein